MLKRLVCLALSILAIYAPGNDSPGVSLSLLATQAQTPRKKQPLDGQIVVDTGNRSWLTRHGDGPFFLAAIGDPEGFLYRGKRNPDGTRDGDQQAIIRKLARHGGNGIYMISVRTHGGDARIDAKQSPSIWPDDLHNPWNGQDPRNGLNAAILNQWETWFFEMDRNGIVIYFFFYDDAINVAARFGWNLDPQGRLHLEEKKFIQALVKRFQHHRNLIWCVMEEAQEIGADWRRHVSALAEAIREADDHDHVIASHQLAGNTFFHADDPNISQFAIQTHAPSVQTRAAFHAWLVEAWRLAGGRYSLNMSEDQAHGALCGKGDRTAVRQRNWAAAMAGAYVMVLGMDGANSPEEWLADCRRLQRFFEAADFRGMVPADELKLAETEYVLSSEAGYILYSSDARSSLGAGRTTAGVYDLKWLDCITGRIVDQPGLKSDGGDQAWRKPGGLGPEVALYAKLRGPIVSSRRTSPPSDRRPTVTGNRPPEVENSTVTTTMNRPVGVQLSYTDPDGGPGPYAVSIVDRPRNGEVSGAGNDLTYTPRPGFSGTDRLRWKVHDGAGESRLAEVKIIVSKPND